ncbi:MAG: VWA domain-containing protein [Acidobacteriota bacterium]
MRSGKKTSRTIICALCGLMALAVRAPGPPAGAQGNQAIRVRVDVVSLPVVVTDRGGKRILDLKKEDFEVYEDGVLQEISGFGATDEPVTIALALDTSGSTETQLARIQNEAIRFVNLLHPDDSVAVLSFADDVSLLEDFSIDRDRNAYGIKETRPGGWTILYEAVWLCLEEVLKPIQERTALVLFTDGVDTRSRHASRKDTVELAKESRATVYCVYFNTERDPRTPIGIGTPRVPGSPVPGWPPVQTTPLPPVQTGASRIEYMEGRAYLHELAEYTGGRVLDVLQMHDLAPAFEEIARELASQYSIGYQSKNDKRDGKFRKVQVKVKQPDLVARTKKGYYAPKEDTSKKK